MPLNGKHGAFFARHPWLTGIGIVLAAGIFLASLMSRGDAVPIRFATAQRMTIRSMVSTNGKVEPADNFEAHAPVGTSIRKLLVKEGDHVTQGQLLLQMDDADARSAAARAQAQISASEADRSALASGGNQEEVLTLQSQLVKTRAERDTAQRNLDALERLQKQGAASPGEVKAADDRLQRATADLNLVQQKQKGRYSKPEIARVEAQKSEAQAAYAAAEDLLRQLNVRAPFHGVVYSLPVKPGAYVNSGDLVLQEANLSQVRVRAFVDEPDVGRLVAGQKIEITWDAMPGRVWQSQVNGIPAVIKLHGTRNVGEITCLVGNADFKLLPNVNVGVTIITAEHANVLSVPREAVHQEDSKSYVYEIVENELHRRDVQTSISNLTQVEVIAGLSENAQVALAPMNAKPLHDGLAVKKVH